MIGAHASIIPSILEGIRYIKSLGGNVVQIFTGGNKSSSLNVKQKVSERQALEIKNYLITHKIYLSIHAIYLLNFCTYPSLSQRIKYAHNNIIYDLELGEQIGAKTVVLHLGFQKDLDEEEAYNNMADNVIHILSKTNITAPSVTLSLETPAGQGSQIASTIDKLSWLFSIIKNQLNEKEKNNELTKGEIKLINKRLKICIDTAHIFSSGENIINEKEMQKYISTITKKFGKRRIELIHLNDSKQPLNSRKDQHQGIGDGYIFSDYNGLKGLKYLINWCKVNSVPIVLETHKAASIKSELSHLYAQEISLISRIETNQITDEELKSWKLMHTSKNKLKTKKTLGKIKKNKTQKQTINLKNKKLLMKIKEIRDYYTNVDFDPIRRKAYNTAYLVLLNYPEEIKSGEQVAHLHGIGKQMVKKINEFINDGEMEIFKELINPRLKEIKLKKQSNNRNKSKTKKINILGFGNKRIEKLNKEGIYSYSDIKKAFKDGKINLNDNEKLGLRYHSDLNKKMSRPESISLYKFIELKIKKSNILKLYDASIEIAGSYPSGKKESKDLDILIFTNKYKKVDSIPEKIINEIIKLFNEKELLGIYQKGNTKLIGIFCHNNTARHVDIRLLPKTAEIAGRLYFTSGRDFNVMIRQYASSKGFLLNEYGLFDRKTRARIELKTEQDLFDKIGLSYIEMSKRRIK